MELARIFQGEIICCDSVQFYQGFDIGSAKPSIEERQEIPHHLFDSVTFPNTMNAAIFGKEARQCVDDILSRHRLPIIVGGSGLYLRAFWEQDFHQFPADPVIRNQLKQIDTSTLYQQLRIKDPSRAEKIHPNDRYRLIRALEIFALTSQPLPEKKEGSELQSRCLTIVLDPPRKEEIDTIRKRAFQMIADGLKVEVQGLMEKGYGTDYPPMTSIGYKQMVSGITLRQDDRQIMEAITIATRQYAKKQRTWFKKIEADLRLDSYQNICLQTLASELSKYFA